MHNKKQTKKRAGGIAVFVRNSPILGPIEFSRSNKDCSLVMVTDLNNIMKLILCCIYVPPRNSSGFDFSLDYFDTPHRAPCKVTEIGTLLICRDFNARMGVLKMMLSETAGG